MIMIVLLHEYGHSLSLHNNILVNNKNYIHYNIYIRSYLNLSNFYTTSIQQND